MTPTHVLRIAGGLAAIALLCGASDAGTTESESLALLSQAPLRLSSTGTALFDVIYTNTAGVGSGVTVKLQAFPNDLPLKVCANAGGQCSTLPATFALAPQTGGTSAWSAFTVQSLDDGYRVGGLIATFSGATGPISSDQLPLQILSSIHATQLLWLEDWPTSVPADQCIGPRNLLFADEAKHPAIPESGTSVTLTMSGVGAYLDPECTLPVSGNTLSPKGAVTSLYFKASTATAAASVSASSTGYLPPAQASFAVSNTTSPTPHLMFVTPSRVFGSGSGNNGLPLGCSDRITLRLTDAAGQAVSPTAALSVGVSAVSGGVATKLWADAACTVPLSSSLAFNPGESEKSFHISDKTRGMIFLKAVATGFTEATQTEVAVPGKPVSLRFLTQPQGSIVNLPVAGPPKLAAADADGVIVALPRTVSMSMTLTQTATLSGTTALTAPDTGADTFTFNNLLIDQALTSATLTATASIPGYANSQPFWVTSSAFSVGTSAPLNAALTGNPASRCDPLAVTLSYGAGPVDPDVLITVCSDRASSAFVVSGFGTIDADPHCMTGKLGATTDGGVLADKVLFADTVHEGVAITVTHGTTKLPALMAGWQGALPSRWKSTVEQGAESIVVGGSAVPVKLILNDGCGIPLSVLPDAALELYPFAPLEVDTPFTETVEPSVFHGALKLLTCPGSLSPLPFKVKINGQPLLEDGTANVRTFSLAPVCTSTGTVNVALFTDKTEAPVGGKVAMTVTLTPVGESVPSRLTFEGTGLKVVSAESAGATFVDGTVILSSPPPESVKITVLAEDVNDQATLQAVARDAVGASLGISAPAQVVVKPAKVDLGCSSSGTGFALSAFALALLGFTRRRASR